MEVAHPVPLHDGVIPTPLLLAECDCADAVLWIISIPFDLFADDSPQTVTGREKPVELPTAYAFDRQSLLLQQRPNEDSLRGTPSAFNGVFTPCWLGVDPLAIPPAARPYLAACSESYLTIVVFELKSSAVIGFRVSMKKPLLLMPLACFLLLAATSQARLNETVQEIEARYGKVIKSVKPEYTATAARVYQKNGFRITVGFYNNGSCYEQFQKVDPKNPNAVLEISETERDSLLQLNCNGCSGKGKLSSELIVTSSSSDSIRRRSSSMCCFGFSDMGNSALLNGRPSGGRFCSQ